jgi:hypothetical protein
MNNMGEWGGEEERRSFSCMQSSYTDSIVQVAVKFLQ